MRVEGFRAVVKVDRAPQTRLFFRHEQVVDKATLCNDETHPDEVRFCKVEASRRKGLSRRGKQLK